MRIVTILEPQNAGRSIAAAAEKRGHEIFLLDRGMVKNPDVAYFRTCTFAPWKDRALKGIAAMHAIGVPTLPSFNDAQLYDDKAAQIGPLKTWLPKTYLIGDGQAAAKIAAEMSFPFISKSRHGAASRNVRLIETRNQAANEIQYAFGAGIPLKGGVQRGYLIWQEFIEGNQHDIRVVLCGENLFGLKRFNREKVPFASGSGKRETIRKLNDPDTRRAFETASYIARELGTRWACFDFVFRAGRVYCLEISFSWVEKAYNECPCFDRETLEPNGRMASAWADFAVDELESLAAIAPHMPGRTHD